MSVAPVQHTAEALTSFMDGEERLIYVAHRYPAVHELYLLEDDTAKDKRAFAKSA